MRDILLSNNLNPHISKWAIYKAASSDLADSLWVQCHLPLNITVHVVSKLRNCEKDLGVVRSETGDISHRHGQGVRCELLNNHRGEDLEPPGLFCPGAFSRVAVESHTDPPLGFPMGNKRNVGSDGNCLCPFATKLYRVLVGRVDIGRAGVQRPWHLGGTEDLPNPRDARVQVGVNTRHREHHWKIEESGVAIHTC